MFGKIVYLVMGILFSSLGYSTEVLCDLPQVKFKIEVYKASNELHNGAFNLEQNKGKPQEEMLDLDLPKADAYVHFNYYGNSHTFRKNIFVFDEGNGNFNLDAYTLSPMGMENIVSLVYSDEGKYLDGYIRLPKYLGFGTDIELVGYSDPVSIDNLDCSASLQLPKSGK